MATGFAGITGQQFFQLLVAHVKAGFLADPIYGGNRNLAGWKMIVLGPRRTTSRQ